MEDQNKLLELLNRKNTIDEVQEYIKKLFH